MGCASSFPMLAILNRNLRQWLERSDITSDRSQKYALRLHYQIR